MNNMSGTLDDIVALNALCFAAEKMRQCGRAWPLGKDWMAPQSAVTVLTRRA